jgi:hypothetical protein
MADADPLMGFTWRVPAEGFIWVERGDTDVDPDYRGPLLTAAPARGRPPRSYAPSTDETGLFLRFAELDRTLEAIRAFANEFGDLGVGDVVDRTTGDEGEPLKAWNDAIECMAAAVQMWKALQRNHLATLRRLERERHYLSSADVLAAISDDLEDYFRDEELSAMVRRGSLRTPATYWLECVINSQLAGAVGFQVRVANQPTNAKPFQQRLVPRNLLAVMWLQLARAASERKEFWDCGCCGKPIEISRTGRRTNTRWCSDACKSKAWRAGQRTT